MSNRRNKTARKKHNSTSSTELLLAYDSRDADRYETADEFESSQSDFLGIDWEISSSDAYVTADELTPRASPAFNKRASIIKSLSPRSICGDIHDKIVKGAVKNKTAFEVHRDGKNRERKVVRKNTELTNNKKKTLDLVLVPPDEPLTYVDFLKKDYDTLVSEASIPTESTAENLDQKSFNKKRDEAWELANAITAVDAFLEARKLSSKIGIVPHNVGQNSVVVCEENAKKNSEYNRQSTSQEFKNSEIK